MTDHIQRAGPRDRPFLVWLGKAALILSAIFPILALFGPAPDTMLLIWPAFVLVWFWRAPLSRMAARLPWPPTLTLILAFILTGLVTEVLAWSSDVLRGADIPVTFHPQLLVDLTLAIGFYGGLGIGWAILRRYFHFSLWQIFLISALYGVVIEQDGAIAMFLVSNILSSPLEALLFATYVALVYGAFATLPFAIINPSLPGTSRSWGRTPLALTFAILFPRLGFALIMGLWALVGGLPAPRSALEYPLW
ncbi:MAG TPA: hypothetical protein ENK28_08125 [Aliiroseovarius sp.]|nr:hypothetical protein [Aliiroseovarius sp.]